ncbi:hypothetical protein MMC22_002728 [Lobaria immixta]|nr:hypothetical protein [Lobaria immixta]
MRMRDDYTTVLNYELIGSTSDHPIDMFRNRVMPNPFGDRSGVRSRPGRNTPVNAVTCDLRNGKQRSCCSKTCTANRDCDGFFTGDCKCYAPPAGLYYWFSGYCGSVHSLPKRDLAQQRRSFYLNATARFASTAAPAPPSDLAAQLASGLLPSPCNASYISFACADSTDGIVHERPQDWLGALLSEGAKAPPPVPEEFLRIHRGEEGKLQVVVD